ncbi:bifunctional UDP-N-acetylglucosamine diphosphorylase/glucosamine-1-phosphate N-acetyltransferase GlmU [Firmicutes bacterium AM55-24TS]|jgi:bifunctional UDP-N-acetylglucosamine pyrophosphorylase/glucosamine-1-phosphate N-acetyltransferase|nr:bifunctional UDP-N-acetylglucosamine diphosphorylase/glucosamine-1-phosphate N-acetyltransferase GlmU [Firmicutes bacterium AM55-24TS]RHP10172.1 bifunctional UDP-N-acetylglucosamine diphosphorylase/glucosamine-1-phosphate N-acetyltransferase GlmU [Firmicutes bacterium AF36-3BH]
MFTSVILAAGMGTRMKSKMPKVLHKVCGKPLSKWVIDASKAAGADKVCAVVGHKAETVKEVLGDVCEFALQAEQKGTGHAVMQAIDVIKNSKGEVVILNGDTPLITAETINKAIEYHKNNGNQATVITAILDDATGYGRIVRDNDGSVLKIVEQKDASEEEKKINEVNSGMYVFDAQSLVYALDKITPNNAQGEYYLTDTLEILLSAGKKIGGYAISDNDEIRGINDRVQLNEAEKIMQKRINEYHMRNGVTMRNPESVYIEDGVEIGNDTEICQNVTIKSGTKIGSDCVIGSGSMLNRAVIHDGVDVLSSVILESEVDEGTHVGPFAYIRPNCHVGKEVKVGDFVELKNSNIDDGTKISHLTYIGDSDVGKRVNFGCGTVTCNYDGKKKYRTTIGDDCFVGCNTNFVSPINVGDGVYIAAGSTITEDIPENSLSIARARQVNKEGWKDKRK